MYQIAILDVVNTKLPTIRDDSGVWISLRELCNGMGLDSRSQIVKLKTDSRYNLSEKVFETNGGKQKKICISINQLPAYLYSINPNKVKASSKQFVLEFQEHTFEVINSYWLRAKTTEPVHAIPQDPTNLLIDLVKATQQQNEMMLQAINNQTTMFKSLQKQMLEVTKAVHYNSDVMYATQEAINMSQKKPSNPTYPTRVPHIVHPDMKPAKLTYMQKKTLDAAKELMRKKQYYEIVDGDEYYRIKGVELTDKLKKHPQYITLTLNTLAQNGYLKKVKLNHVCSVYALPKDQTEGKK
ncbi:MAG: phage antirepressor N-terminal domain-containing protein [Campylobacterales bacterium]|nr:phage antirepressor N-terminal domain-containing protein [Campylobacterales bacterium]